MNTPSQHHMLVLSPPDADAMTGTELRVAIAKAFPNVVPGEALAYTEGAGQALLLAGMDANDVATFLSHWSGNDVRMYVGTLYGIVAQKQNAFAESLGAGTAVIMPSAGLVQ